jgi:predicted RNase H-like HicB family nuclease
MKVSIQILTNAQGGFTAVCMTLPGCAAQADTREMARAKLEEAIRGYLAALGDFVPENLSQELAEV